MKSTQPKNTRRKAQAAQTDTSNVSPNLFRRYVKAAVVSQTGFRTIVCVGRSGHQTLYMLPSW